MKIVLNDALEFLRWFETQLVPKGAHCALAGSVLHKGESTKDLDVIVYPHNESSFGPNETKTKQQLVSVVEQIFPAARELGNPDYPPERTVMRVESHGWRIEFFIFS